MFTLFDILQGQGGAGLQGVGQQFGLSPEQTRRALEALLPAFTIGLQRQAASDPMGLGHLFGLGGPGQPAAARPGGAPDLFLGQMFGSPMLVQAIVQQASATSGVGAQALRQMLPIMAGMIVAGIVHLMLNPPQATASRPPTEPDAGPYAAAGSFWEDMIKSFLTTLPPQGPPANAARARPPAVGDTRRPAAKTPQAPEGSGDTSLDMLNQAFRTGFVVQEQNVRAMQDIFDAIWNSAKRPEADQAAKNPKSQAGHEPDAPRHPGRGSGKGRA